MRSVLGFAASVAHPRFTEHKKEHAESFGRSALIPFLAGIELGYGHDHRWTTDTGPALVRKAEDWLDGRYIQSVDVLNLCQGLNVKLRTLQRAFHETLDMGPSRYLALRRLAHARAALVEKSDGRRTVTSIALDHGFTELGRFSGFYRRYYGETPRQTLARPKQTQTQTTENSSSSLIQQ